MLAGRDADVQVNVGICIRARAHLSARRQTREEQRAAVTAGAAAKDVAESAPLEREPGRLISALMGATTEAFNNNNYRVYLAHAIQA